MTDLPVDKPPSSIGRRLERWSLRATEWTGSSWAFTIALGVLVVWALSGPLFGFSDTWQLVINTGTTIITFLMVFLIQRTQNKDARAMQLKLNEIVAALPQSSNRLIDVESVSEDDLRTLQRHYHELAKLAQQETDLHTSHSIDEATVRHGAKHGRSGQKPLPRHTDKED